MEQCIFHRAIAEGVRFNGTKLTYADFSHADVSRSDFSDASLYRARFHQTTTDETTFTSRAGALGDDELLAEAERWQPKL
jgi:uncharacterized protein YjbI with pentapeptide repeats